MVKSTGPAKVNEEKCGRSPDPISYSNFTVVVVATELIKMSG